MKHLINAEMLGPVNVFALPPQPVLLVLDGDLVVEAEFYDTEFNIATQRHQLRMKYRPTFPLRFLVEDRPFREH